MKNMPLLSEAIEKLNHLSVEELEELKRIVDKTITKRRFEEIADAFEDAKKNERYTYKYYETAADLLASINL